MRIIQRFWVNFELFLQKRLILSLLLISTGFTARACGPFLPTYYGYSFFEVNDISEHEEFPQLLSEFSNFLIGAANKTNVQVKDNVSEWSGRFCNIPNRQDLGKLIYKTSESDLERLRTSVLSKGKTGMPARLAGNTFAEHLIKNRCTETVDYLIFAKKCEPFVTASSGWSDEEQNPTRMYELIEEGQKEFKKTKSHYIRLRYAYQVIRLAHYVKDYNLTLNLFDRLLPQVDARVHSIIHYWILGHRAGALQSLGKRVEAAVIYADIFKNCPSKRMSAFRSFKIKTNQEWSRAMVLCESDSMRAAMHAVRAFNEQSKAVEELEAIYNFHPDDILLKSLTVREIKKLESRFLGENFKNKKENSKDLLNLIKKESEAYLERFSTFTEKIISEKKVKNTDFWELCNGYLKLLKNDLEAAEMIFNDLEKKTKNEAVKSQLKKFTTELQVLKWKTISSFVEEEAYELLNNEQFNAENRDFSRFTLDKMAYLYSISKAPGMAFLCKNEIEKLHPNPPDNMLNDLLEICNKTPKTDFERALTEPLGKTIKYDLLDLKAMKLLAKGNTEAALRIYKQIPRVQWDEFGQYNPFEERIDECVHCPLKYEAALFNKGEIMEKIIELDYKAKAEIGDNEEYLYQLGIIWFNMSYFGHSFQMLDRFRSGSNWYYRNKDHIYTTWMFPLGNKEFHDMSKAQIYFEQARQASKNPEIGAKATYMAARCEQNNWFVMPSPPPNRPREYFKILKGDYSETDFYKEIIRECNYLKFYVEK